LWKIGAGITSGLLLVTLVGALKGSIQLDLPETGNPSVGLVENLGQVLFTDFVVPFEMAGILFLAAMVGAVMVGKRDIKV
jgi:NADH-quinone oxidoreductase subunit J